MWSDIYIVLYRCVNVETEPENAKLTILEQLEYQFFFTATQPWPNMVCVCVCVGGRGGGGAD